MCNFVIAPDSFKGTMEADEVCQIIADSILKYIPNAAIRAIPLADGGEGMVDTYLKLLGGVQVPACVTGPMGAPVECYYGILPDGTAVMEMASCAGLPLVTGQAEPLCATTRGVGELLADANSRGIQNVLLGIGGSATNDCGLGMAAALGFRFLGENGVEIDPIPRHFDCITAIQPPAVMLHMSITVACDVSNPLCGPQGATYTFGKQKGVAPEQMPKLDRSLSRIADMIERDIGVSVRDIPGAGAAGGLGAALVAFLGAELRSGVELVLDAVGFDALLQNTDLVFTGEGRIDWQSVAGKVPVGVARRAKAAGIPCVALCGSVGPNAELVYNHGITAFFSSVLDTSDFSAVQKNCRENLRILSEAVVRLLVTGAFQTPRHGPEREKRAEPLLKEGEAWNSPFYK